MKDKTRRSLPSWSLCGRSSPFGLRQQGRALCALCGAFLVSACASIPEAHSFDLERMNLGGTEPLDRTVALALADARSLPPEAVARGRASPEAAKELLARTALVLREHPFFRRMMQLRNVTEAAVLAGDAPVAALEEARRQNAQLLVTLAVTEYEIGFSGHTRAWWWSAWWWFYAWFPSWWVADERFQVNVALDVQAWDTTTGERIEGSRLEGRAEGVLDDFQRGFVFWGLWRVPGALDESNYVAVRELLSPAAEAKIHDGLVKLLVIDLRKKLRERDSGN